MVQTLEAVAWDPIVVRQQRRYGKLKGLLKKSLPIGIRTTTMNLDNQNKYKKITINMLPSNAKFINPYTFLGLMVHCHQTTTMILYDKDRDVLGTNAGFTNQSPHINFSVHCSYNERNPDFHMAKV